VRNREKQISAISCVRRESSLTNGDLEGDHVGGAAQISVTMSRLARNSLASVTETIGTAAGLILLLRYVAQQLGVQAIGAWSLLAATMSITAIADIGIGRALIHFVPAALVRNRPDQASAYIRTAAMTVALLFAILLIVTYPLFSFALRQAVSASELTPVLAILPHALLSFWLSNIALVYLSALVGAHRADLRSLISLGGVTVQLSTAYFLIPVIGLQGLAWAQIAQNFFVTITAIIFLRRVIPELGLPVGYDPDRLRDMRGYGAKLQLYSVASFVFEPATKMLLSQAGGLASVGFYEMANRLIIQFRTLIVNAIQVFVPTLTSQYAVEPAVAFDTYRKLTNAVCILGMPTMAAVAVLLPGISDLWFGRESHEFIFYARLLTVAWTINLMCAPAFFMALACGKLKWNLVGTALSSLLVVAIAPVLGHYFGAHGVIAAASGAMSAGSFVILTLNHRSFSPGFPTVVNRENLCLLLTLAATIALGNSFVVYMTWHASDARAMLSSLACVLIVAAAALRGHSGLPPLVEMLKGQWSMRQQSHKP
jgi:O-antigen/teichoic acid export membrane protein